MAKTTKVKKNNKPSKKPSRLLWPIVGCSIGLFVAAATIIIILLVNRPNDSDSENIEVVDDYETVEIQAMQETTPSQQVVDTQLDTKNESSFYPQQIQNNTTQTVPESEINTPVNNEPDYSQIEPESSVPSEDPKEEQVTLNCEEIASALYNMVVERIADYYSGLEKDAEDYAKNKAESAGGGEGWVNAYKAEYKQQHFAETQTYQSNLVQSAYLVAVDNGCGNEFLSYGL